MNNEFDCVEMKRKGAERLQKKLVGLTIGEELQFWKERTNELKKEQQTLKKAKKKHQKYNPPIAQNSVFFILSP